MNNDLIEIAIKGIMPTANGCAVFLGTKDKTFVIHIDPNMGLAICLNLQHVHKDRPLTHDLIANIFMGLGVKLKYIVINDIQDATFFARIVLSMDNELGTKIIEIDARPSDAMVLALQGGSPIYILQSVFDRVEDVTAAFNKMLEEGGNGNPLAPEE